MTLAPGLAAAIHEAAAAAAPRECCGLLEGMREGAGFRVSMLHPARNLAPSADRFEIDAADHFAAQRAARGNGKSVIGCYHSHPKGRAQPSPADSAGAAEDNFLWLIASGDELNAFVYLEGGFTPLAIGADCVTSSV